MILCFGVVRLSPAAEVFYEIEKGSPGGEPQTVEKPPSARKVPRRGGGIVALQGQDEVWARSQSPIRCATSPHTVGSHPLHRGAFGCARRGGRFRRPDGSPRRVVLAPEGSIGEGFKSVKKNAALLHFLAFGPFDHLIGVLRGEQPLSRASRAVGSSGHLFGSFWVSKRNKLAAV